LELFMVDRHWLGDLGLAVLFVLPLAMLARPQAVVHQPGPVAVKIATADHSPGKGRISLLG
jgi:hypothetical protein